MSGIRLRACMREKGGAVSGRLEQGEEIEDLLTGLGSLQKYVNIGCELLTRTD
jgi:hypothetical protein